MTFAKPTAQPDVVIGALVIVVVYLDGDGDGDDPFVPPSQSSAADRLALSALNTDGDDRAPP